MIYDGAYASLTGGDGRGGGGDRGAHERIATRDGHHCATRSRQGTGRKLDKNSIISEGLVGVGMTTKIF